MEPGKHQQNVADSHWQDQLLPGTVSPLLPRPVSPWLSCSASPSLSHPMAPSLGHPCTPRRCPHPAQAVAEGAAEGDGMDWACWGHPASPQYTPSVPST